MSWRLVAGRSGSNPHRLAAELRRVHDFLRREFGLVERYDRDAHQSLVAGAERAHGSIVCAGAAIFELGIFLSQELRRCECREHELAAEAEIIERLTPFRGIECAVSAPAFCAADNVGA